MLALEIDDVARTCLMNSVRTRDAQWQWARTSLIVSFKHCSRSEVGSGRFPLTPTTPEILQRAKWYENSVCDTCRLADLQTCRLADLQTCRLADLQTFVTSANHVTLDNNIVTRS